MIRSKFVKMFGIAGITLGFGILAGCGAPATTSKMGDKMDGKMGDKMDGKMDGKMGDKMSTAK